MKTKYKYIYFAKEQPEADWVCYNNHSQAILGFIQWYPKWKQYVIEFTEDIIFNDACLTDIAHFLRQLNQQKPESQRDKCG